MKCRKCFDGFDVIADCKNCYKAVTPDYLEKLLTSEEVLSAVAEKLIEKGVLK